MSQDENAVNNEVVSQESTATESAPVETKTPEVADPLLAVLSDDDEAVVEAPGETKTEEPKVADSEEKADDTASDDDAEKEQPQGEDKPLNPKSENRFQKLANENRELRERIAQLNNEVYKPQTADELVEEGMSPAEARVTALEQKMELTEYNNRVFEAQSSLSEEAGHVISTMDIFNPESDNYQEDLAASAAEALEKALIRDPNVPEIDPATGRPTGKGQIIGSHLSPYQIYKPIADAYQKSSLKGQIAGQKATEKMLASVDAPTSITPKAPKKDPLLEILSSDD